MLSRDDADRPTRPTLRLTGSDEAVGGSSDGPPGTLSLTHSDRLVAAVWLAGSSNQTEPVAAGDRVGIDSVDAVSVGLGFVTTWFDDAEAAALAEYGIAPTEGWAAKEAAYKAHAAREAREAFAPRAWRVEADPARADRLTVTHDPSGERYETRLLRHGGSVVAIARPAVTNEAPN